MEDGPAFQIAHESRVILNIPSHRDRSNGFGPSASTWGLEAHSNPLVSSLRRFAVLSAIAAYEHLSRMAFAFGSKRG